MKRLLTCIVLVVGLAHGAAYASHVDVPDPNDTNGILDIKVVKGFGVLRPGHEITTFKSWTTFSMWDQGYFLIWYDTASTPRFDYYILVRSNGSRMEGTLWRDFSQKADQIVGSAAVWRPNSRSVTARVRLDQMWVGGERETYRWYVQTIKTGGPNCANVCFDRAPNINAIAEPVPAGV